MSVALGLCYTWNVVTDHIWDKLTWDDPKEEALKKRGAGAIPHVKTLDSSNPKVRFNCSAALFLNSTFVDSAA